MPWKATLLSALATAARRRNSQVGPTFWLEGIPSRTFGLKAPAAAMERSDPERGVRDKTLLPKRRKHSPLTEIPGEGAITVLVPPQRSFIRLWRNEIRDADLEGLWELRPEEATRVRVRGQWYTPGRRQLAMGKDYSFSGQLASGVEWDPRVRDVARKVEELCGAKFNGALLNFYEEEDSIGAHSDSEKDLVHGAAIATVSLGCPRVFTLTPQSQGSSSATGAMVDLVLRHGDVLLMEGDTQQTHVHCVSAAKPTWPPEEKGRRISITLRSFRE